MPKRIERRPLNPSSHSPSISLRNWIAPTIWSTPIMMAQAAMNASSTCAVMSGQTKASTPARIPAMPTSTSHQRGTTSPPIPAIAAPRAKDDRVSTPEKDKRHQRNAWPEEGQDAEGDGCDAAEQDKPPV